MLVSHSMEDIARTADRILVMNKGKAAMFDDTKTVFSRGEELEKMGLRVPQVTKIMARLQKMGYNLPSGILTVEQAANEIQTLIDKNIF